MKFVPNTVSLKVARTALVVQKGSPNLLFGVGVAGVIATAVLASRATLKVHEVLDGHDANFARIEEAKLLVDESGERKYSDEDAQKDKVIIYAKTVGQLVKLYGPTVISGVLTIACLTKSHTILTDRNAGLAAAYAIVDKGFKQYRKRVEQTYGKEKDLEFLHGAEEREYLEETKQGPKVVVEKVASRDGRSLYARFFDELNPSWQRNPDYNYVFLRARQMYLNDMLQSRGHVFLNEVYDNLGIERTSEGAVVGWVLGNGDDYVDFGMYDDRPAARDFVQGREPSILLDFNVDGVIYDKI